MKSNPLRNILSAAYPLFLLILLLAGWFQVIRLVVWSSDSKEEEAARKKASVEQRQRLYEETRLLRLRRETEMLKFDDVVRSAKSGKARRYLRDQDNGRLRTDRTTAPHP